MSVQETKHLVDDTILWTLIDPSRLEENDSQHFNKCQICQEKQASFQQELNEIKQLSRKCLPVTTRNLRPVSTQKTVPRVFFRVKNALAYACMIMICIGGVFGLWPTQDKSTDQVAMEQASNFIEEMMDVNQQNDKYSILPFTFQYIVADEFEVMSNPFYDYVFPISTLEIDDS
jgi:hypothetical protein